VTGGIGQDGKPSVTVIRAQMTYLAAWLHLDNFGNRQQFGSTGRNL